MFQALSENIFGEKIKPFTSKEIVKSLFDSANIEVNGSGPWDIQIYDKSFYNKVLLTGSLGLGESYVEGMWDVENLDSFFYHLLSSDLDKKAFSVRSYLNSLSSKIINLQTISRSKIVGQRHYDIGNDLYKCMLDEKMVYTCGYWENANNLDKAQEDKLDLICRKMGLGPGMSVLDIGCGWGSFLSFAAERYKIKGVGVTISKEQASLAQKRCKGLPVDIRLQDYRYMTGKYDRVVSIGMLEHVGHKNYPTFMKKVAESLSDDGLFLLHTIGGNSSVETTDPWINKYIFPNSMIPSLAQVSKAAEELFTLEDFHSFGLDYDKTLVAWFENFDRNWDNLKMSYSDSFYRIWKYYLLSCAGSFRSRKNHLWQLVYSKDGIRENYSIVR